MKDNENVKDLTKISLFKEISDFLNFSFLILPVLLICHLIPFHEEFAPDIFQLFPDGF
jgi:hypothetical protein